MNRKFVSLITAVSILCSTLPFFGITASAEDLTISTLEELEAFRTAVNNGNTYSGSTITLANDIDMSEKYGEDIGGSAVSWTPIGTSAKTFTGTFDGDGHTIKGLYINADSQSYCGLFGYITTATIKNLTVSGSVTGKEYVGGIVGSAADKATFENCENNVTITANRYAGGIAGGAGKNIGRKKATVTGCANTASITAKGNAGGIVGYGLTILSNCYNTGDVTVTSTLSGVDGAGGIVGYLLASGKVSGCFNKGIITLTGSSTKVKDYLGGIVGYSQGTVTDCYNPENISTSDENVYIGGVVGYNYSDQYNKGTVSNCYSLAVVEGTNPGAVVGYNFSGGVVTSCYYVEDTTPDGVGTDNGSADVKKLTLEELSAQSSFEGWNFSDTWVMNKTLARPLLRDVREDKFAVFSGSGTLEMPYILPDVSMLETLFNSVDEGNTYEGKYFSITEDIDMSEEYGADINGKEVSWIPIGTKDNVFAGTVLGGNHTISGLYINAPQEDYQGLFGYITGTVQDLTVTGSVTGKDYVGGIAGCVDGGKIYNCHNLAVIDANTSAGGIIGGAENSAEITSCSNTAGITAHGTAGGIAGSGDSHIADCFNVGNITSEGSADAQESVGGITGILSSGGIIERCFNKSTITISGGRADLKDYLGGIAGLNDGTISNSYNAGFAETKDENVITGGVAGSSSGSLVNTYSAGNVSGSGVTGESTGSVTSSYYLESTAQSGEPSQELSESDFAQQSTFASWNFDDIWEMSTMYGRPLLKRIPENEFAIFNGGGTISNPYIISNLALLEAFRDAVNSGNNYENRYFKITADIDMSEKYGDGKESWTAIGRYTNDTNKYTFAGYLDGNGKKITGFYLSGTGYQQGLFGYNEGTIENLTVEGSVSGSTYVGAFVGYNKGNLKYCISNVNVAGTERYTGGIVGWNNGGSIEECYNTGDISGGEDVGGIAGNSNDSAVIKNCYNTGEVKGTRRVGGITGQNGGTLQTGYNIGVVNDAASGTNIGGIAGGNSGTVTSCYYLNTSAAGGINNSDAAGSAQALTEEEFDHQSLFKNWDFINTWGLCDDLGRLVLRFIPEGEVKYFKGAGTEEVPYIISDVGTLEKLFDYVSNGAGEDEYYIVTEDIDLSEKYGADTEEGEVSWSPIGNSTNEFNAYFNGNGHTISGLYINTTEDNQGLFGVVGEKGLIQDIKVKGSVTGGDNVGIIAGMSKGLIERCNSSGHVNGGENAGGITGNNDGGSVQISYSNTEVRADSSAGGLIGLNSGTLQNGYNIALVTGSNTGGIVGVNKGSMQKCYNIGEVLGDENIGSIAGVNDGELTRCHYIRNAGHSISAGIGLDNASGSASSISKVQFSNQLMFPEWDFYDIWVISDILARPVLRDVTEDSIKVFEGSGTEDDPYIIPDIETLEKFARYINAGYGVGDYFKLADDADIDMTGRYGSGLEEWVPIGNTTNRFNGHFDGNNKTIKGLVIDSTDGYQGLFGCIGDTGYVKDITVDGSINGKDDVGAIAGSNAGTLENCHNLSTVSGVSTVGGLVGYNSGTINNCDNAGNISGTSDVGGISGYNTNTGSVTNCICKNTEDGVLNTVTAQSNAGGISGRSAGTVENCLTVCAVNADNGAGGVVGSNNGRVNSCESVAKVAGNEDAGGIVGTNTSNGIISGCRYDKDVTEAESDGGVSASSHAGGIAGRNAGTIENSFNTYHIDGGEDGSEIGGIVGYNTANVRNSFSVSTVSGGSRVGGAIGYNIAGNQVSKCYYNSDVYKEENTVTGTVGMKTDKFSNGTVTYLMQSGQADQSTLVWGQDITPDSDEPIPVLTSDAETKRVYKVTFATEEQPEFADAYANYGYTVELPIPDDTYVLVFRKWMTTQDPKGEEFTDETPITADITVYAVGEVKYGEKEIDKVVSTTYGLGATKNLSDYTEFDDGTTPAGEAFKYEITGGTNPALQVSIEGDILTVLDTSDAGEYILEITATQDIGPQITLFSVGNDTVAFTFNVEIDIERAEGTGSVTMGDYECLDETVSPVAVSATNGIGNVTYTYKEKDADDSTYTDDKPLIAGDYVVRATFAPNTNYKTVIATDEFTVTHNFSDEWSHDENDHWHECVCGERTDIVAHEWDEGVVTKEENCTEAGNKRFVCAVCGQIRNDEIPAWGHDLTYTLEDNVVRETCLNGCDHNETMTFIIQSGVTIEYSDGWLGGDVDVVYTSGDEVYTAIPRAGTYEASFSIGDFTAEMPIIIRSRSGGGGSGGKNAAVSSPNPTSSPEPTPTASPEATASPIPTDIPEVRQHKAYIIGNDYGDFRPDGNITRAEITAILATLDGFDNGDYNSSFKDVYPDTWYNKYIGFEENKNILTGYEDGTFHPEEPLNRAELAAIMVKYMGLKASDDTSKEVFSDIDGHWAEPQIRICYAKGYISGYEDNTFKPDNYITRAEAVSMINRVLGRVPDKAAVAESMDTIYSAVFSDVPITHWGYYDVAEASVTHDIHDFH